MKELYLRPVVFLILALAARSVSPQSIDEMIASAYESVDEFDQLADLSGNTIRQELDMLLTREQADALKVLEKTEHLKGDPRLIRKRRKAARSLRYRWNNNVIPYTIASGVFSESERYQISSAITEWEKYTCIDFRPANRNDNNRVHFDNGKGCYSYVGKTNRGSQKIGLAKGCRFKGVVVHEIGHAVGFHHEQNRPDRDDYVRIIKQNIPSTLYYNFKKYPSSAVDTMGVPYDYSSVMHYGGTAFSKNGQYTIRTIKSEDQSKIGNRKGLSFHDIMLANKMYKCNKHCNQNIQCPRGAFVGKDCQCWCPGYPVTKCSSTGTVPTTTGAPTRVTQPSSCKDQNQHCPAWAKAQYCSSNTYVKTYCKKSCGFCSNVQLTTQPSCVDFKDACTFWGEKGFCTGRYEVFMSEKCPRTCKVCGSAIKNPEDGNVETTTESLEKCSETNEGCGSPDNSGNFVNCSVSAVLFYSLYAFFRSIL